RGLRRFRCHRPARRGGRRVHRLPGPGMVGRELLPPRERAAAPQPETAGHSRSDRAAAEPTLRRAPAEACAAARRAAHFHSRTYRQRLPEAALSELKQWPTPDNSQRAPRQRWSAETAVEVTGLAGHSASKPLWRVETTMSALCVRLSCDSYLTILAGREVCYVF